MPVRPRRVHLPLKRENPEDKRAAKKWLGHRANQRDTDVAQILAVVCHRVVAAADASGHAPDVQSSRTNGVRGLSQAGTVWPRQALHPSARASRDRALGAAWSASAREACSI
ncbi:hypothetical protein MRX96_016567 [Rhipicephalus microplus]